MNLVTTMKSKAADNAVAGARLPARTTKRN
jgi:hypothetical protein